MFVEEKKKKVMAISTHDASNRMTAEAVTSQKNNSKSEEPNVCRKE